MGSATMLNRLRSLFARQPKGPTMRQATNDEPEIAAARGRVKETAGAARAHVHRALTGTARGEHLRQSANALHGLTLQKANEAVAAQQARATALRDQVAALDDQITEGHLRLNTMGERRSGLQRQLDAAEDLVAQLKPNPTLSSTVTFVNVDSLLPPGDLPLLNAAAWSLLVAEARRRNAISATIIVNELTG